MWGEERGALCLEVVVVGRPSRVDLRGWPAPQVLQRWGGRWVSQACLPALWACLPALGACLPALGACLPELGACLPELGACLPIPGACLPAPGACLPAPAVSLLWLLLSLRTTQEGFAEPVAPCKLGRLPACLIVAPPPHRRATLTASGAT